jgi:uncharacterized protein
MSDPSAASMPSPPDAEPSTVRGDSRGRAGALGVLRSALRASGWPARTVLVGLIRLYRATLSGVLGGQCRFEPSCSAYAEAAIRARGATVGSALAAWRVLRCNPFVRGGSDMPPRVPLYDNGIHRGRAA